MRVCESVVFEITKHQRRITTEANIRKTTNKLTNSQNTGSQLVKCTGTFSWNCQFFVDSQLSSSWGVLYSLCIPKLISYVCVHICIQFIEKIILVSIPSYMHSSFKSYLHWFCTCLFYLYMCGCIFSLKFTFPHTLK